MLKGKNGFLFDLFWGCITERIDGMALESKKGSRYVSKEMC